MNLSKKVLVIHRQGCTSTAQTKWAGNIKLYKAKNNRCDLRCYSFRYLEETWPRDPDIRRVIVQASNPKGNTIEVSILSNDKTRPAQQIIELMFSRWLQENDFKYLDVHFDINGITSYAVIPYAQLEKAMEDKQMKNGFYKALEKQKTSVNQKLKICLLQNHFAKKACPKRLKKIEDLTAQLQGIQSDFT